MGQALYRTYRSRALSEVVGQEHITDTLARAIKAGRVSHAYLFTGSRGVGKTSVARILAHEINGLPYSDTPNLDIIEIDAASNRRIDDIRDLREKIHIAPVSAKYKVYIIDEVHMLTGESFNALLKTLEEPPSHVVFILATTEVHKLPATIISRTQRYTFKPGDPDTIAAHLKTIASKEKITIDREALALIAEHSDGSFRDSLSLLDQMAHITTGDITASHVAEALGLAPKKHITNLVSALTTGNIQEVMRIAGELEQQAVHVSAVVDQLNKALLDCCASHPRFLQLIHELLEVPRAYRPHLKLITTLASFCINQPKTPRASAAAVGTAQPRTIATLPPQPAKTPEGPPTEPNPEPLPPAVSPAEPLHDITAEQWTHMLETAKQKSPPIYSVLKQASPAVRNGALVLTFKFALHGRKLEGAKQKAFIASVAQEVLGKAPEVTIVIGEASNMLVAQPNQHIAEITEIMGGGEVINGATI